jgi:hypothetical protein
MSTMMVMPPRAVTAGDAPRLVEPGQHSAQALRLEPAPALDG